MFLLGTDTEEAVEIKTLLYASLALLICHTCLLQALSDPTPLIENDSLRIDTVEALGMETLL